MHNIDLYKILGFSLNDQQKIIIQQPINMKFDNKKIKRKTRRDEAVEVSKHVNLKTMAFKNKKKYIRKKKHRNER